MKRNKTIMEISNYHEFMKNLHPKNKITLYLGRNDNDNYFDINLGEEQQQKIVDFFKKDAKKVVHQQCKYYYYNDMKYIITHNGIHKCMKNKIHRYTTSENILLCSLQEINIPIESFPPITNYHDTRIIERSLFIYPKFSFEAVNVVYPSGIISYECTITGNINNSKIKFFLEQFNFSLNFTTPVNIEHGSSNVLSII